MGLSGARDVLSNVWNLSRESDSQEQRTIVSPPTGNFTKYARRWDFERDPCRTFLPACKRPALPSPIWAALRRVPRALGAISGLFSVVGERCIVL